MTTAYCQMALPLIAFALACAPPLVPPGDDTIAVRGTAAKGPFQAGSSVVITSGVNEVVSTTVSDALGHFSATVHGAAIEVSVTGAYLDELTGAASSAPVALRARASVQNLGQRDVSVNVITHLIDARVQALVDDGDRIDDAQATAASELYGALALGATPPTRVPNEITLVDGDSDDAAYLLYASAVLLEVAARDGSSAQAVLDRFAADLADGNLDDENVSAAHAAERDVVLVLDDVVLHVQTALHDAGSSSRAPDPRRILGGPG
ncbi:MAG TPA: hypothetical protein VGO62_18045, partial [Myxococcota bacterium]